MYFPLRPSGACSACFLKDFQMPAFQNLTLHPENYFYGIMCVLNMCARKALSSARDFSIGQIFCSFPIFRLSYTHQAYAHQAEVYNQTPADGISYETTKRTDCGRKYFHFTTFLRGLVR